ncbi:hypothetical protein J2W56_001089 [Nocardia kruczakiae]|uniref:SnoaL-like domain-containing protein n=1 Tax=Nocardia kruczakiae TaxID=261477 RepID=A0ABU1XA00_9NOCA|nr:nuclear transport factor 2 family protein [Nocardia kruczakiae]MDR7167371.1 hypothetical protein [Nocardia kruczakiae]
MRDTYAGYTHAGDRFPLDELAAWFATDGTLELARGQVATSRAAIVAMLRDGARDRRPEGEPPQIRHLVTNLLFTAIAADRVDASAYFCVLIRSGNHIGPDDLGALL